LDVHFFVSAVLLQKRTGGNLAKSWTSSLRHSGTRFKLRGASAVSAWTHDCDFMSCIPIAVAI
jgi:hypothetical protein